MSAASVKGMLDFATAIPLLTSILTAVGAGSLITSWASGAKDRRSARAGALEAFAAVEAARWNVEDPGLELQSIVRKFETAALIARLPRQAVGRYVRLALACLYALHDEAERTGQTEWVGLNSDTADLVGDAAGLMSDVIWSNSLLRGLWLPQQIRTLDADLDALDDPGFLNHYRRARTITR
jgi:hypothetical protein